ncbi:MAG: thioesterase family protein [Pseudomonadota bacterium]
MTILLSELLAGADFADNQFRAEIPEGWMQGRTTYGGLTAALCFEAAQRAAPDAPPLRSANFAFVGPAGGAVEARADILRQGRSMSFIDVLLSCDGAPAARATFAFGAERPSHFDTEWRPAPALPKPDDCEEYIPRGLGPAFLRHLEMRLAKGSRPATGATENEIILWARHIDETARGPAALLALADAPPPAVLPMFPHFKPISTATWSVNMLSDNLESPDGWYLLSSTAEGARHGYSAQDMAIWTSAGDLIVTGKQTIAIFV